MKINFKKLTKENEQLIINRFVSYREFLKLLYKKVKETVDKYSYYKFASDLGFSESNVIWLTISGRRKLTRNSGNKIAKAIGLTTEEKNYLLLLIDYNNTSKPDVREDIFQKIVQLNQSSKPSERLEYFSEWYHPVIREMTALKDFKSDPKWICSKLCVRILPKQAKDSLKLLEELDLIRFDKESNRHHRTEEQILPDRETQNFALIRYHQKMSEIAKDTLVKVQAKKKRLQRSHTLLKKKKPL